jgi:hypothetical protein
MAPEVVTTLQKKGHPVVNAAITLRDRELMHLARDAKRSRGAALTHDQELALPRLLAAARAVFWDVEDPTLIYVLDVRGGAADKAIMRVNWEGRL